MLKVSCTYFKEDRMTKLIGRVLATEKSPTTMDEFNFWTNSDLKLHAFDIVKVEHIECYLKLKSELFKPER
jgi:hypothetical protein